MRAFTAIFTALFWATMLPAQQPMLGGRPISSGGGSTFSVVHVAGNDVIGGTTTFALTVPSTTAGNDIVVFVGNTATTITDLSVVDNASGGSNTYTQRTASRCMHSVSNFQGVFWDSLATARGSATTITVTFDNAPGYAMMVAWEVHRSTGTTAYDTAGVVNNGLGVLNTVSGPSVAATGSPAFLAAGIIADSGPITANPASGNVFTSGGVIVPNGGNAGASYAAASAGTYQPVWTDGSSADAFCASVVAYK